MRKSFFVRPDATRPSAAATAHASAVRGSVLPPLFFFGTLLGLAGLALYSAGILLALLRATLGFGDGVRSWNEAIVWFSGLLCSVGALLIALDLVLLLPAKRKQSRRKVFETVLDRTVVVALTAYNDEQSCPGPVSLHVVELIKAT